MQFSQPGKMFKPAMVISVAILSSVGLGMSAEQNTRTFTAGQKTTIQGVILTHEGDTLKVRGDDDSIGTVSLTGTTKIQLKRGFFSGSSQVQADALVPGLEIKVQGKGNEGGDLVANKVFFDPNSKRVSRQVDARVDPVAARTNVLEGRADLLESRAGHMEAKQGQLEDQEKQTRQQVGQVQTKVDQVDTKADRANQGVENVNERVANLDNYKEKYSETVYFRVNSAILTPEDKQKLDNLAAQAKSEKGYAVEVAGFADKTGSVAYNQQLTDRRANAVKQYLEQQGDIPIHRILSPAGMAATHPAADNGTVAGRKLNRRVEVKVIVNEGIIVAPAQTASIPE